jgi:thiol-disulfide isomerase/thioredoxin
MRTGALHIGGRLLGVVAAIGWLCVAPAAQGSTGAVANHADVPGIDWYAGDVAAAFTFAGRQNKPVFLYWGAKWCPPCQQLKSSVFSRSDFQARLHQFVAVYLDGDDPGAQKWGEKFRVTGYPTVVILRPDQREVTRLSGGMDLSLYADLLDNAEADIRPIGDVLTALQADPAGLPRSDCQRLAYYGWQLADYAADERTRLGTALAGAAQACAGVTPVERARLTVIAASLQVSAQSAEQVTAVVANAQLAPAVVDTLEGLDKTFFAAVLAQGPAASAQFRRDWERTMDAVAADPQRIDADQLYAIGTKLEVVKQFMAPAPLPAGLAGQARERVAAALARHGDPYVRAGVVNAASFIYEQLGDDVAEEALLRGELLTARAPYYYMADLGELEEKHGHAAPALVWFERAYRESQGTATRFQWGNMYLAALLRLAPDDRQRIRSVAAAVLANLDGPDRIHARTRHVLEKLDGRLRQWNAAHRHDADLRQIRKVMQGLCSKLPRDDEGLQSCHDFLAGAA